MSTQAISLTLSIIGIVVSLIALVKSFGADRRDREAVVIVDRITERKGDRYFLLEGDYLAPVDSPPTTAFDEELVITGAPTIADGLELRPPSQKDTDDRDVQNYNTHRVVIGITNAGRAAATDIVIRTLLTGTYPTRGVHETRAFAGELRFVGLPISAQRRIEIRSIPGIPIRLEFTGIRCGSSGRQPVQLRAPIFRFHPRG
jgi:hypothetical protein